MRKDVRAKLIDVAKKGKNIAYMKLGREFGIPRGHFKRGIGIGCVVGGISEYEHDKGRPMISAIVVRANSATKICPYGVPGGGFFGLSGIPTHLMRSESEFEKPLTKLEQEFVFNEQRKVWQYWKVNEDQED